MSDQHDAAERQTYLETRRASVGRAQRVDLDQDLPLASPDDIPVATPETLEAIQAEFGRVRKPAGPEVDEPLEPEPDTPSDVAPTECEEPPAE